MERLHEIGKIKAYRSDQLTNKRFGIGLEKLDRNVFDPNKTYDAIQNIGVHYVRLQSGWARTERVKGVYDFAWLDEIVDNLIARGLEPWLCLCYGNGLYSESANQYFGCVGVPPIFTDEEKMGWKNYCTAVAKHYRGRIHKYEVWNEPDGKSLWKHGPDGAQYGRFVCDTSVAVKSVDSEAEIIAGSIAKRFSVKWLEDAFSTGMAEHIDALTYHLYQPSERLAPATVTMWRTIAHKYGKHIKIIQGESGCPSSSLGHGAIHSGAWTQERQAKLLLRRQLVDLTTGVEFSSHFTTVDMIEALKGLQSEKASYLDYGYFGVLQAEFDENGCSIGEYKPKLSYYAFQNLCAVFGNGAEQTDLPVMFSDPVYAKRVYGMTENPADLTTVCFRKENGSTALFYYKPTDLLKESFVGYTSITASMPMDMLRLTDLLTGKVYAIPESMLNVQGSGVFDIIELLVKDYPMMLTFGDFFDVE